METSEQNTPETSGATAAEPASGASAAPSGDSITAAGNAPAAAGSEAAGASEGTAAAPGGDSVGSAAPGGADAAGVTPAEAADGASAKTAGAASAGATGDDSAKAADAAPAKTSERREHPRTGVTPVPGGSRQRPKAVDPKVLTDDRKNPDLLVFEKTWGHRLLAGLGFAMIVVGLVLIIYCATKLPSFVPLLTSDQHLVTLGLVLYGMGLIAGILVIPPAIVALWVSRHPRHVNVAIALAIVALVLVAAFVVYALAIAGTSPVTTAVYAVLLALLPVLYLIAALKIKRS